MIWTVIYLLSFNSSTHIFYISLEQQKLKKLDSVMLNKVIVEYNIYECAFPNVEISLRIFFNINGPKLQNWAPILSNEGIKNPNRTMRQERLESLSLFMIEAVCCTKLTLRIKLKIANKKFRRKLFKV